MLFKALYLSLGLIIIPLMAYCDTSDPGNASAATNTNSRWSETGAQDTYDGSIYITGANTVGKFTEAIAVSTPTAPSSNHFRVFYSSFTNELCTVDSTHTVNCLSATSGPTFTNVTSYTPTVAGHGTVGGMVAEYRQMGDVIDVWAIYTAGTVAGTTWSLTVPVNINLTAIQNTQVILGNMGIPDPGTVNGLLIFTDGVDNTKVFVTSPVHGTAGGGFRKEVGNFFANTGDIVSVKFSYPK